MTRVAIFSADIGEGHASVARALADDIRAAEPAAEVVVLHSLEVLGEPLRGVLERGFRRHCGHGTRAYDVTYRACMGIGPVATAGERALLLLGGEALRRRVAELAADVVVSTYPVITAVLGGLRERRRLPVPALATVSDVVGLRFWVHRGVDCSMVMYPQSLAEAGRIAGPERVRLVRPVLRHEFERPPDRAQARRELCLPPEGPVIVVSGGGWAVGDLPAAVDAALAVERATVVVLAGRRGAARADLTRRYAAEPRVSVLGFCESMPALLAAADALVHATGGVTALEARAVGCPLVCFGHAIGHVRANTRALAAAGVATLAAAPDDVTRALRSVLAAPVPGPARCEDRPAAAELVLAAAGAGQAAATGRA